MPRTAPVAVLFIFLYSDCAVRGPSRYPNCPQVYADCVSVYIDTVLSTAAQWSAVPLWPVSPSAGWDSGVDTATGVPDGGRLVERDDAMASPARPLQGALDVHGPYDGICDPGSIRYDGFSSNHSVLFHSEFGQLSLPQFETIQAALPDPRTWSLQSAAMNERSPNGAAQLQARIEGTLGHGLANFSRASEADLRRVIYLSQLAQSECLKVSI